LRTGTEETRDISQPLKQWSMSSLPEYFEDNESYGAMKDTDAFG
jgi:hypothetical protein